MSDSLRVMTVLGTRPEIIRLSRVIPLLDSITQHTLVHTGQNAGDSLSAVFFQDLGVREPDVFLSVDTSSVGRQLGTLFERFETALDKHRPDRVLILGDTNSALVAYNCKRRGIPVYHMEAGNRCYDDRVPEEVNRRVIDHCSSILMPYTERSAENLVREGIERHRIFVTGNPIHEVLTSYESLVDASDALTVHNVAANRYLLATMHRAENVDNAATFASLCGSLAQVANDRAMPLILSVHPRIRAKVTSELFAGTRVIAVDALPFATFVRLERDAALVLTDSGTVQEECAILHTPVITIRNSTERPETIEAGSNIVSSTRPEDIRRAARYLHSAIANPDWCAPEGYMAHNVADKVVRIILSDPAWASAWHTRS